MTMAAFIAEVIALFLVISGVQGGQGKSQESLVVVGKNYKEQRVLCELVSPAIERETGLHEVRKNNLGGTQVVFNAMKSKDVDLYVEYTGSPGLRKLMGWSFPKKLALTALRLIIRFRSSAMRFMKNTRN